MDALFRTFFWGASLFFLVQGLNALYLGEIKASGAVLVRRAEPGRFRREALLHFLTPAVMISGLILTQGPDPHYRLTSWALLAGFLPILLRDLSEGRSSLGPLATRQKEPTDYWTRTGVLAFLLALMAVRIVVES